MAKDYEPSEIDEEEIEEEDEDSAQDDQSSTQVKTMVTAPQSSIPDSIKPAVSRLTDDIMTLGESKEHVTFLMAVNINTAKADLVPIPTIENMARLKEHLERFPESVKAALKDNIPNEDMEAAESIWALLDSAKNRLDSDTPSLQESKQH